MNSIVDDFIKNREVR